jgi:UV DNA damage endonuclease
MGMPRSHWSKINIHIGASYGDRDSAITRWLRNFERLPDSVKSRLTVENDDRESLFSTKMLYHGIYKTAGVPIVFDSHHYACGHQDSSYDEALGMAVESWPKGITPQCHHSNSKKNYENPKVGKTAHSDWYYEPFQDLGHTLDVVLEAKMKEKSLIKYSKDFS